MNRIKGRGRTWILAVLCVLLAAATVVLTVLCVRAARDLRDALQTRDRHSVSAEKLRGELDSLNGELGRLVSERERSEEDLSDKTAKIESLEELISGLNDERDSLNGENDELTAQLEEANRVADLLREDVEGLNRRIDAKREAAAVLRERSRQLTEAVESLEGELSDAQGALDDKKTELNDAKKRLMTTQTELKVTQSERDDARNELDDAKSELDRSKSELEDAREALDASEKARKTTGETLVPAVGKSASASSGAADLNEAEKVLIDTLRDAPDRWDWIENRTKLVEVKTTVAFYTAALDGSEELAYNADTVLYAASLIKAPYILSVLREIEDFEKTAVRDESGGIVYRAWEQRYNLDEEWVYDPDTMQTEGSGEIMNRGAGLRLTWRELFEYSLLYSDNIAFSQIYNRFGFASFDTLVRRLGIEGQSAGFMYLTARDCGKFLTEIYRYFETGTAYALWMKDLMTRSRYEEMIAAYYPAGTVAHKYGWDVNAFHDMAIVYEERPYVIVLMTDYEDGGNAAFAFFASIVDLTKAVYALK